MPNANPANPQLCTMHATKCAPQSPACHTFFHGNAFNPDTGKLAEYVELSKSSDHGTLWQQAYTTKIHLAQGMAAIPRTNTMFFIPVSVIPQAAMPPTSALFAPMIAWLAPKGCTALCLLDCWW